MNDHCKRGHPFDATNTMWHTTDTGRRERRCRSCKRIAMSNRKDCDGLPSLRTTFLPVEPLMRLAPRPVHDEVGNERGGVQTVLSNSQARKYHRAAALGRITLAAADEISTAFGYHPAEVWGNEWWTAG